MLTIILISCLLVTLALVISVWMSSTRISKHIPFQTSTNFSNSVLKIVMSVILAGYIFAILLLTGLVGSSGVKQTSITVPMRSSLQMKYYHSR